MAKIGSKDTDADALVKRIAAHDKFGERDINDWVFSTAGIRTGKRILDLGCGTGKQVLSLVQRGCKVVGVDVSDAALDQIRSKVEGHQVELLHGEFDEVVSKLEGSYDAVLSVYAIYYAKNSEALFDRIRQLLVVDGVFFFCGPAYDNNMEVKSLLTSIGQVFTPGAAPFMEDDGPDLARRVFGNAELSKFENALHFDSPEALWTYWSSHNMFDASVEQKFRARAEDHFKSNRTFRAVKRVRGVRAVRRA